MRENNQKNNNGFEYISLRDATELCSYSQEYLSLRARRGKLKSVKLGRNWVTTKEWLSEYINKVGEYNNLVNNSHENEKVDGTIKEKIVKDRIVHSPPENLPIIQDNEFRLNFGTLGLGFAAALLLTLIGAAVFFERQSLIRGYSDLLPCMGEISEGGGLFIKNIAQNVTMFSQAIGRLSDDFLVATVNHQGAIKLLSNIFEKYGQWLKSQISEAWFENITR